MNDLENTYQPENTNKIENAYQIETNKLAILINSDINTGLTEQAAQKILHARGANSLPSKKQTSFLSIIIRQFLNPLMFILVISTIISLAIKQITDATVILIAIVINSILGIIQEWKADQALQKLRSFEEPECTVKRDGTITKIATKNLVVGDLVILTAGARVPADIRLIEVIDCTIDEALLT
ncbi:MAG: cation-transporting P-type ATPase, partial [bacterium]